MTEIERKVLALVNDEPGAKECCHLGEVSSQRAIYALCRAIEQHEAFRQEVSDAIQRVAYGEEYASLLLPFIITKPDPLLEALAGAFGEGYEQVEADNLRAAIEKRGGKIVWDQDQ